MTPDAAVSSSVLALLRAGGRNVGDGEYQGSNPATAVDYPFAVFYPILGGAYTGPPLTGPALDVVLGYQVTCTGTSRRSAQALADELQVRAHGRTAAGAFVYPLVVAGWTVLDRHPADTPSGVDAVGDPPSRLFSVPVRFTVTVTPAP